MGDYVAAIWAHEEFGRGSGTGHEGLARAGAGQPGNDPYKAIEGFAGFDSTALVSQVRSTLTPISNSITIASADGPNGPKNNLNASGHLWFWDLGNPPSTLAWHGYTWTTGGF
jgi:hypothetical protein